MPEEKRREVSAGEPIVNVLEKVVKNAAAKLPKQEGTPATQTEMMLWHRHDVVKRTLKVLEKWKETP